MEPEGSSYLFNLLIMILLLFTNGFFVASEFALVSVRQTRIAQLAGEGNYQAKTVLIALKDLDRYIAAVQLGITVSSIGLGWVGEATLARLIEPIFAFLPDGYRTFATHGVAVTIAFVLITFLHVVLGELMPKSIALQYPEQTALKVAGPMKWATRILSPFIFLLNGLGNFLLKLIGIPPAHTVKTPHSTEELDMIIDASYQHGVLNETEKDILQNVFKFSDLTAKQVMVPRPDMICVPVSLSLDALKKLVYEYQYTRYPVYGEDIDDILGILHVKDIYAAMMDSKIYEIKSLLREVMLIPETVTLDNLLMEFKRAKAQIAVVVDEFGDTSGLVTLEDVIEEIFGDVQDEFDEEEEKIRPLSDTEFMINGMLRLDELNAYFDTHIDDEDMETVGGLVVKELGRIAATGDTVQIGPLEIMVTEIDGPRVVTIKVTKLPDEDMPEEE